MSNERPSPDALLQRVRQEDAARRRGRLKVFHGAAPGVGKTYSMLEDARARKKEGRDVVVGWVETHGRSETAALLEGLEILPPRQVQHRGITLGEFDLEAALARRPELLLIDGFAHTNAPGSRFVKRWQDVLEVVGAGIDVYTTVNVQHFESLNDVVAQITGVVVRETVPDSFLEQADEVELVDLPPDELQKRLAEGKVYVPEEARRAIDSFFKKGNLIALRELALRRTAERVDAQMRGYRQEHGVSDIWPAAERLLVCVGPAPLSARLVRATSRMAQASKAEWFAVHVATPRESAAAETERDRVTQNLLLAERLGARTAAIAGSKVSEEVLRYARVHNITRIIVGKPTHSRWRDFVFGSLVEEIVRGSAEIDVHVISGAGADEPRARAPDANAAAPRTAPSDFAQAAAVVGACTAFGFVLIPHLELADVTMVYLLGVLVVAVRLSRGPAVLAAVLSVVAFDFFFVPPRWTFAVSDAKYILTFVVMLVIGLTVGTLTARLRRQALDAREKERRTAALYELARDFALSDDAVTLMGVVGHHIVEVFRCRSTVFAPDAGGKLQPVRGGTTSYQVDEREATVAQWVFERGRPAGRGTDTLPAVEACYFPLVTRRGTVGVLGIKPATPAQFLEPARRSFLEAFANQTALALERAMLAEEAREARISTENERLRNALLSSVSHDLRTPIAAMTGAASLLVEGEAVLEPRVREELALTIKEEGDRLHRLIRNLLDATRLESGAVALKREPQPLEEVVGSALNRLEELLEDRLVTTRLPDDLPLVPIDAVLLEQVFVNLLENAVKFTPDKSPIDISAAPEADSLLVEIADRGPGIPPGEAERIFAKFYRLRRDGDAGGSGLGLVICRAIVGLHGGRIWVEERPGGGAAFRFTLPLAAAVARPGAADGNAPPQVEAAP